MTSPIIVGAGLSGLIAARMLADQSPLVVELASSLPNNHKAVLRFKSNEISMVTNIPFKKVSVLKAVHDSKGPVADAVAYGLKVTGKLHVRSVINTAPSERYVAPADFISRLASTAKIAYDNPIEKVGIGPRPIISTIPMPDLMNVLEWPHNERPNFESRKGWTLRAQVQPSLESQLYATIYYPDPLVPWYRASFTGSDFILEGVGEQTLDEISAEYNARTIHSSWGLPSRGVFVPGSMALHPARYQKVSELSFSDREKAKRFIMWASKEHGVYSLGRFATWRPKLMLDDLANDVRVISKLMQGWVGGTPK